MAFAHYPRFYDTLWSALAPIVGSAAFDDACIELRVCAEREAAALSPKNILGRLTEMGYQDREIEELRACNEIFSAGNMPYLLMASLARLLLEGGVWQDGSAPGNVLERRPGVARPVLIEPHHADPMIAALYTDIRDTLGLPFVNTDYRAFARWPSYFSAAWPDLKVAIQTSSYEVHVGRVHERALSIAAELPNTTGLTSIALQAAAALNEMLASRRCLPSLGCSSGFCPVLRSTSLFFGLLYTEKPSCRSSTSDSAPALSLHGSNLWLPSKLGYAEWLCDWRRSALWPSELTSAATR